MEGRCPNVIRLIQTSCTDPAQETGFNKWYDDVHTPDVLSSGLVSHVVRYRNTDPDDRGPGYLAVHELTTRDVDAVARQVARTRRRLTASGGFHPALAILRAESWRNIGGTPAPARTAARVAGIFVIGTRCPAPERAQFDTWYDATHIPDLLDTGLFVSAHRFAAVAAGTLVGPGAPPDGAVSTGDHASGAACLAMYETVIDPVEAVREYSRTFRPRLEAAGRLSKIGVVTWRGTYRQIVSRAAT
jgi:hypothetical protein